MTLFFLSAKLLLGYRFILGKLISNNLYNGWLVLFSCHDNLNWPLFFPPFYDPTVFASRCRLSGAAVKESLEMLRCSGERTAKSIDEID